MNACLIGNEPGLILFNNFNHIIESTKTFPSLKGNDAVLTNIFVDPMTPNFPTMYRNGACKDDDTQISSIFLPPFTVHVFHGEPVITSTTEYYSQSNTCGGENVQLIATSSSGQISWWDSEMGGTFLGVGDTLTVYTDHDMEVYAQPSTMCQRVYEWVDIHGFPEVTSLYVGNPICPGDYLAYANVHYAYSSETNGVKFYDAPTGGNLVDAWDENTEIYENDTLYAEAYNNYCVANERIPLVVPVTEVKITSTTNDTICHEGSATLSATGVGGLIEWWDFNWNKVHTGPVYNTPILNQTTQYKVRAAGSCTSNFDTVTATVIKLDRFDTVLVCGSFVWANGNGHLYTQSDSSIIYTKHNAVGCDSILHLNLTVVPDNLDLSVSKNDMCSGDSSVITINSSLAQFTYTIKDTSNNAIVFGPVNGNGSALTFNTGALFVSKGYEVNKEATTIANGDILYCLKQEIVNITVGHTVSHETAFTCDSYEWHGNTYYQTGAYNDTLTSVNGCDSIVTLNLTIYGASYKTETISACESYTWHDSTYTVSTDSATWIGVSPYGCDSIVTLHLTIHHPATGTDVQEACGSYKWIDGITYTTSTNTPTFMISTPGYCDSVVTLNLTIKQIPLAGHDTISTCDSYTWIDGITYTESNNTASYSLLGANGCDSTIYLHLTISHNATTTTESACNSYTWTDGNTYTSSGVYSQVLTAANGCDSTLVLDLTIHNSSLTQEIKSICSGESYNWHGTDYSATGVYYDSLVSAYGCDSIYKLTLTVHQVTTASFSGLSSEYCKADNPALLVGNHSTSGTFSGNGIFANNIFNPINANVGVNSISYSFTDSVGCTATYSQDVTINDLPVIDVVVTNSDCNLATGTAQINVSGGATPYNYSTGSSSASNLSSGIYSVTVTDNKGCSKSKKYTINDNSGPVVSVISSYQVSFSYSCDGSATTSVTGGTAPYSVLWSSNESTISANSLCTGEQSVEVTDATGCKSGEIITINASQPSSSIYGRITYSGGGLDGQYAKLNVYSKTQHASGGFDLLPSNYIIASDGTYYLEDFSADTYVLRVEMLP